ncbi:hypothetical protein WDD9_001760 [Paenibacillus melissococcoides]|uniref:hypothetical protein n=1 Tax=Paenibacillus melissococcoides TaxID=2912268 RepID=UPI0021C2D342|nr:hypothetical protein [Paenibacillus melissococcoides]CAH8707880.1 hypothetical protein WDD9_001760 [Paenibacillus melissococcoides]
MPPGAPPISKQDTRRINAILQKCLAGCLPAPSEQGQITVGSGGTGGLDHRQHVNKTRQLVNVA